MSFVAGVGYANCDILYSGIDRLPGEGEEIYAKSLEVQLGGGVPATMINLKRLGIPSKFLTFLGKDIFSGYVESELNRHGVEYLNLYQGEGIPLAVSSAMITRHDRTFMSYHDTVSITEEIINRIYEGLHGAEVIDMHVGFLDAYKRLKKEGSILVFDVGWEEGLTLEKYEEYLKLADYFTPNQKEALKITNTASVEEAAKVLGAYFEEVIIKLDRKGCLYVKDGKSTIVPPLPDIKAVDSTGAGDAFMSGFIYGLYKGESTLQSIAYGNVTGGTCVQGVGCLTRYVAEPELLLKAKKLYDTRIQLEKGA